MKFLPTLGLLAACHHTAALPTTPPTAAHPTAGRASDHPRLVVLLVLDQWPEWAFEIKRPALTGGGFDRLLSEGTWHTGEYPYAATMTAPGHALLGTGAPTATSGILANEWYHRDVDRRMHSVEDEDGKPSAKWLRVPALGDALARANHGAHAVAVSLKDRASILPLGRAGLPLWYSPKQLAFVTSVEPPPPWLATQRAIEPRIHAPWTPSRDDLDKLSGRPDDAPEEIGEKKLGPTFPHDPDKSGDAADAVYAEPLGNDLVLETALAAIDGEHLGADATPDLLVVSLSAHDYVGHGWGHESQEMWDMTIRLDAALAQFLAALDTKVGAGNWALLATSDHGAAPAPALAHPRGGIVTFADVKDAAQRTAVAELGAGDWIADAKYPSVYVTKAFLAQPEKERAIALKKIMLALRSIPGVARVAKTADVAGDCARRPAGDDRAICLSLDPERSGELVWLPAPNWVVAEAGDPTTTAHGSLNAYDRRVPVIELAPGRIAHAPLAHADATLVPMTDVAPLLARWLGVPPPSAISLDVPPP